MATDPAQDEASAKNPASTSWADILNIIVLSLAALAITWCSYQSTLWSGIQLFRLARSNGAFRMAQEEEMTIMQRQLMDAEIVINFTDAAVANDTAKARFYIDRSRPELSHILAAWIAQNPLHNRAAPAHPAATEEYKQMVEQIFVPVEDLKSRGNDRWKEAEIANEHSDHYVLLTVIFSIVMFLAGVAAKMTSPKMAILMNFISAAILIFMLGVLIFKMPLAGAYDSKSMNTELHNPE